MESSCITPYQVVKTDKDYSFYTDAGVKYSAYFREYAMDFYYLYEFGFYRNQEGRFSLDRRIKETIKLILLDFWKNHDNIILFVCDSMDGRSLSRQRLFNRWYSEMGVPYGIVKYDFEVDILRASVLSYKDNMWLRPTLVELDRLFKLMQGQS